MGGPPEWRVALKKSARVASFLWKSKNALHGLSRENDSLRPLAALLAYDLWISGSRVSSIKRIRGDA
jgi:hypothetical protein